LGTEFGLYVSLDGGSQWARFKGNLPKVGVREIAIHPREHDLLLATHGRGIYIIDDLTPLRSLTPGVLDSDVAILGTRVTKMLVPAMSQQFTGDNEFVGANPRSGAQIAYFLKKRSMFGSMKVEILGADGNVLATLPAGKRRGINRVSWNMRQKPPKVAPAASLVPQMWSFFGPQAAEGEYRIRLTKGKDTHEGTIRCEMDPRADYTTEGRALQDTTVTRLYTMVERLTFVVDSVIDVQKQITQRTKQVAKDSDDATSLNDFHGRLESFRKTLVATRKGGFIAGEQQLREHLTSLYGAVNGYEGRPTSSQVDYMETLESRLSQAETDADMHLSAEVTTLNEKLSGSTASPITRLTREQWEIKQKGG
jgi:hypothetical protein